MVGRIVGACRCGFSSLLRVSAMHSRVSSHSRAFAKYVFFLEKFGTCLWDSNTDTVAAPDTSAPGVLTAKPQRLWTRSYL